VRILLPIPKCDWSPSQRRHTYGPEDKFYWTITARLNDGHPVWKGKFLDRDDADAFLLAAVSGSLNIEPPLWRLSNPEYFPLEYPVTWYVLTNVVLSGGAGSGNQSFTTPADYSASGSFWLTVGAGGGGAAVNNSGSAAAVTGAGGGASNQITNRLLSGVITYNVPAGGAGGNITTPNAIAPGSLGANCWFGATTLTSSFVGSSGGGGGNGNFGTPTTSGGAGGVATAGVGTGNNGGNGGNTVSGSLGRTGAGGAGGRTAAGVAGTTGSGRTAGGAGDGGTGGAGGLASGAGTGGNGTEFGDGATGSGGGGGGGTITAGGTNIGPSGGLYGGGGGGVVDSSTSTVNLTGGPGRQGVVFGQYTPMSVGSVFENMPMMGM